jgi:hypothetical protein
MSALSVDDRLNRLKLALVQLVALSGSDDPAVMGLEGEEVREACWTVAQHAREDLSALQHALPTKVMFLAAPDECEANR